MSDPRLNNVVQHRSSDRCSDAPRGVGGEALSGELISQVHDLDGRAIGCFVELKVQDPNVIGVSSVGMTDPDVVPGMTQASQVGSTKRLDSPLPARQQAALAGVVKKSHRYFSRDLVPPNFACISSSSLSADTTIPTTAARSSSASR